MKRKYRIILAAIVVLILGGMVFSKKGKNKQETAEEAKKPYFITVESFEDLQEDPTIEKNGKLLGEQDITISSQLSARVKSIDFDIGSIVEPETVVITLEDNSGVYSFNAQRAAAGLESARINYDNTMLSLDKAITDTQLALEQATSQFNSATDDYGNSSTTIQLQKTDAELDKAQFDYQTRLQSDQQTINNFIASTRSQTNDFKILYNDVVVEADKLLGVSPIYKTLNDEFEQKLGASNTQTKRSAETQLRLAYNQQNSVNSLPENLSQEQLTPHLETMISQLSILTDLLNDIDNMLNNTLGSDELTDIELSAYIGSFAGLQATVQGTESGLISLQNNIQSFLATYRQQQESLARNLSIAQQQRDLLARNLQDAETSADIGVDSAQVAVNTTLKNKDTTQSALRNAIQQAQIGYSEAQNQLAKLKVKTPIKGTIGQVFVDEGQEVGPGTPLFTISNNDQPQIQISVGNDELHFVDVGQHVQITADEDTLTGTITSIARTADNNFTYQVIISIETTVSLLGSLAKVDIPVKGQYPLLPINDIQIVNKSTGILWYLEDGEIMQKAVDLGDVWGNLVEIRSNHLADLQIITSDIRNYDPNKFELSIQ